MKLCQFATLTQQLRAFPRRIRRGLIEAPLKNHQVNSGQRHFLGEFAGASLKRRIAESVLIGFRDFPGEFAGASLKPEEHALPVAIAQYFPGEFAGASLKR